MTARRTRRLPALLLCAAGLPSGEAGAAPPQLQERAGFVPVGVQYRPDPDPVRRRTDLEEMRRLRFNVVVLVETTESPGIELASIDRLLSGAADTRVSIPSLATIRVTSGMPAAALRRDAWYLLGLGHRAIVFDDWPALRGNTDALAAAAEFAEHVTRNGALYAPLRPRPPKPEAPDVTLAGNDDRNVSARFLESGDALVLVVTGSAFDRPREITMTFSAEMPEAIWQNMLTGGAVNFVAGPTGPTYTRTLEPNGVLVLMIRTRWR